MPNKAPARKFKNIVPGMVKVCKLIGELSLLRDLISSYRISIRE
jgi:hypothetical protein